MARIRTIKPQFFKHESLFDAEKESGLPLRLAYAGLWIIADREGRFEWRPRTIKTDVLPYDDIDMGRVLDALVKYRFILKYKCAGENYGHIPKFKEHQHVNPRESDSTLPSPDDADQENDASENELSRVSHASATRQHPAHGEGEGVSGSLDYGEQEWSSGAPQADAPAPKPKMVRGTRWPKDKKIPASWLEDAATRRLENALEPVDLRLEAEKFSNHWASKAGGDGAKLDWHATWVNWVLRANKSAKNGTGKSTSLDRHLAGIAMLIEGEEEPGRD